MLSIQFQRSNESPHPPRSSNLKQKSPAIARRGHVLDSIGAGEMNRTPDLLITNELLYRLSYTGNVGAIVATGPSGSGHGLLVITRHAFDLMA